MKNKTSKLVKQIARNIKKLKERRNISYGEIARRSGVNLSTIEKIIYPRIQDIQISTLKKIAKALRVTVNDLIE